MRTPDETDDGAPETPGQLCDLEKTLGWHVTNGSTAGLLEMRAGGDLNKRLIDVMTPGELEEYLEEQRLSLRQAKVHLSGQARVMAEQSFKRMIEFLDQELEPRDIDIPEQAVRRAQLNQVFHLFIMTGLSLG